MVLFDELAVCGPQPPEPIGAGYLGERDAVRVTMVA
jgi:hypothetical protein